MPGMPEKIAKTPFFRRFDALTRERSGRRALRKQLTRCRDLVDLGLRLGVIEPGAEETHIRDDILGSWWPEAQPVEPIVRQGLIVALDVAIANDLPIDSYWICAAAGPECVEVFSALSDRQVTLTLLTPPPPDWALRADEEEEEDIWVVKRDGDLWPRRLCPTDLD